MLTIAVVFFLRLQALRKVNYLLFDVNLKTGQGALKGFFEGKGKWGGMELR